MPLLCAMRHLPLEILACIAHRCFATTSVNFAVANFPMRALLKPLHRATRRRTSVGLTFLAPLPHTASNAPIKSVKLLQPQHLGVVLHMHQT